MVLNQPQKIVVWVCEEPGKKTCKVRPQDVVVSNTFTAGNFGKCEVEVAAGHLVKFFQMKGYWGAFTLHELIEFYKVMEWSTNLMLFGLIGYWFDDSIFGDAVINDDALIVQFPDGTFCVTEKFIKYCTDQP